MFFYYLYQVSCNNSKQNLSLLIGFCIIFVFIGIIFIGFMMWENGLCCCKNLELEEKKKKMLEEEKNKTIITSSLIPPLFFTQEIKDPLLQADLIEKI